MPKARAMAQEAEGREAYLLETNVASALVLKSGLLYYGDTTCVMIRIDDDFAAIGSGANAALAAMHCGRSPSEAVKIACKVDMNSGLPVIEKRLV